MLLVMRCEEPERVVPRAGRPTSNPIREGEVAYGLMRASMVEEQLRARGIADNAVLVSMERVQRHLFVPDPYRGQAYEDHPLPIGSGQTISQPYIVALMTEAVKPAKNMRALDVGTGSGYQAAILAELVREVVSLEIICDLADEARGRLAELGYSNVEVRCCDGYGGAPDKAPFDIIVVAAAPDHIPQPLLEQLAPGGRMVIPVGSINQELVLIQKGPGGKLKKTDLAPVIFVPMTGESERGKSE